ncbi:MAG: methyltransferase domain-containing protein [Treponema sp.]|jgi:ubiquinone/menaquinone biosynthesis C-methylase UbiE|nr:methyltransferase domain-containing protein [Treponema sp.]
MSGNIDGCSQTAVSGGSTSGTAPGPREKLLANWTAGTAAYSAIVNRELHSFKRAAWLDLIRKNAGNGGMLNALDIGTGPGFFAILMALEGHRVTAVDCTESMIAEARLNAEREGASVNFMLADSHATDFADETFDLIISRNVTWTLLNADKAYSEWKRILKPEGRVLIFDANWNRRLFDEKVLKEYERSMDDYQRLFNEKVPDFTEAELDYRRSMPMCGRLRPQWDFDALLRVGYRKISCDMDIGRRVYDEKELVKYRVNPMFLLIAQK